MLYQVDFLLVNQEEFKKEDRIVPSFVLAKNFDTALKLARAYESANATLCEIKPHVSHDAIVVAKGYVGVAKTTKEEKESA